MPQGSPLSPFLFNIFLNDLEPPRDCEIALFADDIAFISTVTNKKYDLPKLVERMEKGLEKVQSNLTDWKLVINDTKTEAILFTKSTKMNNIKTDNKIKVNDNALDWQNEVKYLGVILDSKLTLSANIKHNILKAKKAISTLYCLLKRSSRVDQKLKISMYKAYIRPILCYACPVFTHIAQTHLNKLQVQQNKALRMVLNAPLRTRIKKLHERANILSITDYTHKLTKNFFERCDINKNNLIRNLGTNKFSTPNMRTKHRVPTRFF